MGHHRRNYGYGQGDGHGSGFGREALGRMPRSLKIVLALVALVVVLVGVALAVLVVLLLVKFAGGGALPSAFQNAWDFLQRNLPPLLEFWKMVQGATGK